MIVREMFSDVLPIIEKYAPTIGKALGGPFGFVIGYVIPILAKAFDVPKNDFTSLMTNINEDQDAPEKLQHLETKYCDSICKLLEGFKEFENAEINIKLEHPIDNVA